MVATLPTAKVHQTPERRNYLYATALIEPPELEYRMFFTVRRAPVEARHHLDLFVESAYAVEIGDPKARLKRPNTVRFQVLALKTYRNEPLRFAPR